jgi:hypothetical protein
MDRRLRNRIVIFLVLAGIVAFALVRLSGRQPVAKISAVSPMRENIISSISSNGKVEPIAPSVMRAQLDTFVEKVSGEKRALAAGIKREGCGSAVGGRSLQAFARRGRPARRASRRAVG